MRERPEGNARPEDLVPAARVVVPFQEIAAPLSSVGLAHGEIAEAEEHVGPGLEQGTLQGELVRHPFVVRIEKRNQFAPRRPNAEVAGRSGALVPALEYPDAVAEGRQGSRGAVG